MKEKNDQIIIEESQIHNFVINDQVASKKRFQVIRKGISGRVIPSLLLVALLSISTYSGINLFLYKKDLKNKNMEEDRIKKNLERNINNADLAVVKMFFLEALDDLEIMQDSNLVAKNAYPEMCDIMISLEKSENIDEYAQNIKSGAILASAGDIYFGAGKYEKYLYAKNYEGEIFFPLAIALPNYQEEDLFGSITITYLPDDLTPYVSSLELMEFTKQKEIKKNIYR